MPAKSALLDSGLRRNDEKQPLLPSVGSIGCGDKNSVWYRGGWQKWQRGKTSYPRWAGCLPLTDRAGHYGSGGGVGVVSGGRGVWWFLVLEPLGPQLCHGVDQLSTEHAGSDAEQDDDRAKELDCSNRGEEVGYPPQGDKQASNGSAVKQIHTNVETAFLFSHVQKISSKPDGVKSKVFAGMASSWLLAAFIAHWGRSWPCQRCSLKNWGLSHFTVLGKEQFFLFFFQLKKKLGSGRVLESATR